MEKEWIKSVIFSIVGYLLCAFTVLLISFENNYNNLNNGIILMILFYTQLLLIMANVILVNKKSRLYSVSMVLWQRIELVLRFIVFLIINVNTDRFGIHIYLQDKLIIITCSVILSSIFIIFNYKRLKKMKAFITIESNMNSTKGMSGNDSQNFEHISLAGILLYLYSVSLIYREISNITLEFKFLAFCLALVLIVKRIKSYHSNLMKNKLLLIIIGLIVGFLSNFILAIILRRYMNSIDIMDFNEIKDGMFIVAMICAIPLLKEYTGGSTKVN